jgi:superfamily I DNA/RNA helicase
MDALHAARDSFPAIRTSAPLPMRFHADLHARLPHRRRGRAGRRARRSPRRQRRAGAASAAGHIADDAATAEERRLLFVGMRRAKDRLVLTRARKRLWRGRVRPMEPSRFLAAIESALVRHQHMEGRAKPEDRQLKLL